MNLADGKSHVFNLNGLRRLLNEIDIKNSEEIGDYYLESLRVTHGGPGNSITYFQIIGWDEDDKKRSLEVHYSKSGIGTNKGFKEYAKKFPKTCEAFLKNCYPILEEVVKQGLEIDTIFTLLRGDVEFRLMKYHNGNIELRGGYYWSETYEDEILG